MTPPLPDWCNSSAEIARLLRWLDDSDELGDVADVIAIVEKPWHWDREYQLMCAEQADGGRNRTLAEVEEEIAGEDMNARR
jgi:hypothetical protein